MSIVARSSDTVLLPTGYTAYIFGVSYILPNVKVLTAAHVVCLQSATSDWMQQVVVKVQNTSGNDFNEIKFQGLNGPMVVTSGSLGFVDQQTVVVPANHTKNRHLELIFSTYENQTSATGDAQEIKGFQKDPYTSTVVPWVSTYIYRTEDGGDSDYDDTTFVVTLVHQEDAIPAISNNSRKCKKLTKIFSMQNLQNRVGGYTIDRN
ncbi:hypothetical protein K503DRAFT_773940 [Rhizopogon vinicolor AM-OR11-026]|uniref:Uncharacterized protein n=1 Tax=Rhizopogon vinicolor AM-OR11-026 TaxID=1314800 RepID=A0A1B7MQU3_9AGAM|nr:hypothetical protein K503DRAFT_773940 [Rhizopogon vinicolor AM-OR11-026]